MKRLINILYSVAAGLEQASVTYHTIEQAHKSAAALPAHPPPRIKAPMGFTSTVT